MEKRLSLGIVAHVDAGKTTLSEGILLLANAIRKAGRVDHGDTHFDTDSQERARGITIFSSQASFTYKDTEITLIDTPGHVDFAAETERVLSVLDICVLVISAAEGVQSHTKTLWRLLKRLHIPVFVFFNKTDISERSDENLTIELMDIFGEGFVAFSDIHGNPLYDINERNEEIALIDEAIMEGYLDTGEIPVDSIKKLIIEERLIPVYFGSALNNTGIQLLLDGIAEYSKHKPYYDDFAARVYKIASDDKGNRLTFMKLTGGSIAIRQPIEGVSISDVEDESEAEIAQSRWTEKVTAIRKYNGDRYENITEAEAGEVIAVCGLTRTSCGMALGAEEGDIAPSFVPVISYCMRFEGNIKPHEAYRKIKELEDELPELSLKWDAQQRQITVRLMGAIQTEILTKLIHDRYGYVIGFDAGRIAYKETICNTVEGVGHFEPLRHYAEVHLKLEPGERGSGLELHMNCSEDVLAKNWQRLIYSHLKEKMHKGVLTGSPITDMKLTVVSGKAHPKHTEGGDFRQATYRAVRQGLMKAESLLLEPYYSFTLELPNAQLGRAMTDIDAMSGKCQAPEMSGDTAILKGVAPVATMHEYATDVAAYTAGEGRLSLDIAGYYPCHNADEVISERGYDAESDMRNPASSVFCTHGAGFAVPWDEVESYMHVQSVLADGGSNDDYVMPVVIPKEAKSNKYEGTLEEDKELFEIFEREFGPIKRFTGNEAKEIKAPPKPATGKTTEDYKSKREEIKKKSRENAKHYLLVDGYNVIHSWEKLKELANEDLAAARGSLCDILCDYQGYTGCEVIVVFDAYKVEGGIGSVSKYNNIYVIYTKEAETADAYIEKATHEIAKENMVTVVSSDGMVQLIVMGAGAVRLSSREFALELKEVKDDFREKYLNGKE